jgi:chromosome segregation ATPase
MPRTPHPEQTSLPLDLDPGVNQHEDEVVAAPTTDTPRRGRPRIWASEAERKKAYRERLAADHAEPERLRRVLRIERKRVAERDQRLARLDRKLTRAHGENRDLSARNEDLLASIEALEAEIETWRSQLRQVEQRLDDERERAREASSKSVNPPRKSGRSRTDLRHPPPAIPPEAPPRRRRD